MNAPRDEAPSFSAEFEGDKIKLEVSDGKNTVVLKLSTVQIKGLIVALWMLVRGGGGIAAHMQDFLWGMGRKANRHDCTCAVPAKPLPEHPFACPWRVRMQKAAGVRA